MKKITFISLLVFSFWLLMACKKEAVAVVPIVAETQSTLLVTTPNSVTEGQNVSYSFITTGKIVAVQIVLENVEVGNATIIDNKSTFAYTFLKAAKNQSLIFKGLDGSGKTLATQTYTLEVLVKPNQVLVVKDMPYFYQYDNAQNPSGSCQNTCVAMVLKYFAQQEGKPNASDITPDAISKAWGTSKAQSVAGMEDLFNKEAAARGLSVREKGTETTPLADFREAAKLAKPIIVHGYFTNYGHIMVVLGFDGTFYTCNDPAGKWSQQYKNGGYNTKNNTEGIYIKYSKKAFEDAISPDGMVWMHVFK
jgi:hypothetical protein